MSLVLYGIPNCNKVAKSKEWLEHYNLAYVFHDYKKKGIELATLKKWIERAGLNEIVNRQGTTWKKLTPEQQRNLMNPEAATNVMMEFPSVIRRPILEWDGNLFVGFDEPQWRSKLPV